MVYTKSGYDYILLSEDSQQYFGIEWQGWWLVCFTLPFGWKNSPYVYQTVGLTPTVFFRNLGVACSLYIDDCLNGELFTPVGFWSRFISQQDRDFSFHSAEAALFIVSKVLVHFGYFLGIKKCVLTLVMRIVDSSQQAFVVPEDKRVKIAHFRESILGYQSSMLLKSI